MLDQLQNVTALLVHPIIIVQIPPPSALAQRTLAPQWLVTAYTNADAGPCVYLQQYHTRQPHPPLNSDQLWQRLQRSPHRFGQRKQRLSGHPPVKS